MPVNTDAGVTTDSSTPCQAIDTSAALWLLASVAQLYQRPFDATLILARYPPPFDYPMLIEALALLGIQAGLQPWPEKKSGLTPACRGFSSAGSRTRTRIVRRGSA